MTGLRNRLTLLVCVTLAARELAVAQQGPAPGTFVFRSEVNDVKILVDGKYVGVVSAAEPLKVAGMAPGRHNIEATKTGYQSGGPLEEIVSAGRESNFTIFQSGAGVLTIVKPQPAVPATAPPAPRPPPAPAPEPSAPISQPTQPTPVARMTGRSLLVQNQPEAREYGLYSYLLFGLRPGGRGSERYRRYARAVAAYLEIEDVGAVRQYARTQDINITYLPVTASPPKGEVDALLDAYDYARAQRILALIGVPHGNGPIILSARVSLSNEGSLPREHLFQDLSTVPPNVVRLWVEHFIEQAARQRFWEQKTRDQFILDLRTYIARGGVEMTGLNTAFATLVWRAGPNTR